MKAEDSLEGEAVQEADDGHGECAQKPNDRHRGDLRAQLPSHEPEPTALRIEAEGLGLIMQMNIAKSRNNTTNGNSHDDSDAESEQGPNDPHTSVSGNRMAALGTDSLGDNGRVTADERADSEPMPSNVFENEYISREHLYVEKADFEELDLIDLYIFAKPNGVRKLRDDIITTIVYEHSRSQHIMCPAGIALAFLELPPQDRLRDLIVCEQVFYGGGERNLDQWDQLPPTFLANVIRDSRNFVSLADFCEPHDLTEVCVYHVHRSPDEIEACGELCDRLFHRLHERRVDFYQVGFAYFGDLRPPSPKSKSSIKRSCTCMSCTSKPTSKKLCTCTSCAPKPTSKKPCTGKSRATK
ncbi:hypothetical protein LTR36_010857 [Oleoguttula mirabilis]|uniref:Uncharacterized protein n=1 Tax=Oleoguttula mirabilis TaxID=1507867 RepID=A0AAV9J4D0_9PEZI|nr:hypothetical protein LTR36_010857 [Oleoguttula mirabilis]